MLFTCEEKCFIKLVSQSKGWGTKRIKFVNNFLSKSGLSALLTRLTRRTRLIEWKTGSERLQTVRSEQNHKHMAELMFGHQGSPGSSRSLREIKNLTVISLSSGFCKKLSCTQNVIKCYFGALTIL